jgi:hypothetical protein
VRHQRGDLFERDRRKVNRLLFRSGQFLLALVLVLTAFAGALSVRAMHRALIVSVLAAGHLSLRIVHALRDATRPYRCRHGSSQRQDGGDGQQTATHSSIVGGGSKHVK